MASRPNFVLVAIRPGEQWQITDTSSDLATSASFFITNDRRRPRGVLADGRRGRLRRVGHGDVRPDLDPERERRRRLRRQRGDLDRQRARRRLDRRQRRQRSRSLRPATRPSTRSCSGISVAVSIGQSLGGSVAIGVAIAKNRHRRTPTAPLRPRSRPTSSGSTRHGDQRADGHCGRRADDLGARPRGLRGDRWLVQRSAVAAAGSGVSVDNRSSRACAPTSIGSGVVRARQHRPAERQRHHVDRGDRRGDHDRRQPRAVGA